MDWLTNPEYGLDIFGLMKLVSTFRRLALKEGHHGAVGSGKVIGAAAATAAGLVLAALLPIDRLVRPDRDAGVLDQLAVRGFADELVAAVKIVAHAIAFGIPLLVALLSLRAVLAALLLGNPRQAPTFSCRVHWAWGQPLRARGLIWRSRYCRR